MGSGAAGIQLATRATTSNATEKDSYVRGSVALTPYSCDASNRLSPERLHVTIQARSIEETLSLTRYADRRLTL